MRRKKMNYYESTFIRFEIGLKKKKEHESGQEDAEICTDGLINSVPHSKRSSVELAIQSFDPAFGIGELLSETIYLLLPPSFAVAELEKLIDALYRYMEEQEKLSVIGFDVQDGQRTSFQTLATLCMGILWE
jgi:hypothetical protein